MVSQARLSIQTKAMQDMGRVPVRHGRGHGRGSGVIASSVGGGSASTRMVHFVRERFGGAVKCGTSSKNDVVFCSASFVDRVC